MFYALHTTRGSLETTVRTIGTIAGTTMLPWMVQSM